MNAADLRQWLIQHLADYLAIPAAAVDPAATLRSYGLDSLYALTLGADIEDAFGLLVEPTLTWDHPTIEAIANHLAGHLTDQAGGRP